MSSLEKPLDYVDLLVLVGETNRCPGGKRTIRRIAQRLGIGPHTNVLEIGSNTGFTSLELARISGCRATGVELNPSAVEAAERWRANQTASVSERVRFLVGDARELQFEDDSFDVIVCGGANTFVQDRERAFEEYRRVLRPDGYISITNLYYRRTPDPKMLRDLGDILGFDVPAYGLNEWLEVLHPPRWELYDLDTQMLTSRPDWVVDAHVDDLCAGKLDHLPEARREEVREQWRRTMHVFNRNHAFLGFMELTLRYERDGEPEQPELFLPCGAYDAFYEHAFVSEHDQDVT